MSWETLSWIFVAMSLVGNVFIIKKNVLGQWIWAVSNIGWVSYNLYLGAHAQAFLFTVYTGLCIWGIITWSRKDASPTKATA